jgi:probable O-glycosylation ligase (exosortase A-associated)
MPMGKILIDNIRPEWWRPESGQRPPGLNASGERTSPVPFWALVGFTFVLLISPQTYFPALSSVRPALLVASVGILAYLIDQLVHRRPVLRITREMRITTWLVCWAVVTTPLSLWFWGSVSVLLDLYFKTLIVFWLLYTTVNNLVRLRRIAWSLTLMGIPIALAAVRNYLSGIQLAKFERITGYEGGLTENPNDLALMLNLIFPLTMALLICSRKPRTRYVLMGILFLYILAIVATFSRGGFVTLAALFFIYLWKFRNRSEKKWLIAVLLIVLLCVPFLPSAYWNRISTTVNSKSDATSSAQERLQIMSAAVIFVIKHPIVGAGFGMSILAMNEEGGTFWTDVHNAYLQYAVDLGLPGLVLFLMLMVACFKSTIKVQRESARAPALQELFFLAQGVQISLWAFSIAALFHPVAYHLYFYYMAGLAVALRAVYEFERARDAGWSLSFNHDRAAVSGPVGAIDAVR